MQHLNIHKSQIKEVIVGYAVNRHVAHIKTNDDKLVAFASNAKYADLLENDELVKYCDDWDIPFRQSRLSKSMAILQLGK